MYIVYLLGGGTDAEISCYPSSEVIILYPNECCWLVPGTYPS
jgi:hypothetical protein